MSSRADAVGMMFGNFRHNLLDDGDFRWRGAWDVMDVLDLRCTLSVEPCRISDHTPLGRNLLNDPLPCLALSERLSALAESGGLEGQALSELVAFADCGMGGRIRRGSGYERVRF
jgi:hypothetical protein